jgi:hypothetical protein
MDDCMVIFNRRFVLCEQRMKKNVICQHSHIPWQITFFFVHCILEPFHQFEADLVYLKVQKVILDEL